MIKQKSPLGVESRGPEKHAAGKIGLDLIQDTVLSPEYLAGTSGIKSYCHLYNVARSGPYYVVHFMREPSKFRFY